MIEVENLVKRYGGHLAVDHLSFTVEKGCVCGFLGPNGAGKSTTMNMMTGYLAPTEGEVRVDGHSVTQDPAGAKACIGYLPGAAAPLCGHDGAGVSGVRRRAQADPRESGPLSWTASWR